MTAARSDPQDGLFDDVIENDVLAQALERRQSLKDKRGDAQRDFKTADDEAKARIAALGLDPGTVVRCGRFRIEVKRRAGRSVAFETDPKDVTTIGLFEDQ